MNLPRRISRIGIVLLSSLGAIATSASKADSQTLAYMCEVEDVFLPTLESDAAGQNTLKMLRDLKKGKAISVTIRDRTATINPTWLIGGPLEAQAYQLGTDTDAWKFISVAQRGERGAVHTLVINDYRTANKKINSQGRETFSFVYSVDGNVAYGRCIRS